MSIAHASQISRRKSPSVYAYAFDRMGRQFGRYSRPIGANDI